jgi:hypothetical protein
VSKVTVRIPVLVDARGRWAAYGWHNMDAPDWAMIDEVIDHENPTINPQRYFVTAELDVPEELTVEASHVEQSP